MANHPETMPLDSESHMPIANAPVLALALSVQCRSKVVGAYSIAANLELAAFSLAVILDTENKLSLGELVPGGNLTCQ